MSIFGKIMSAIFGHASAAGAAPAAGGSPAGAAPATRGTSAGPAAAPGAAAAKPMTDVDVSAVLTTLAAKNKEKLDWRKSIVDLMKLLKLDSSFGARKELAKELGYAGDSNDSATMNVWLHKEVLRKLSENGGKVPANLLK